MVVVTIQCSSDDVTSDGDRRELQICIKTLCVTSEAGACEKQCVNNSTDGK